MLSVSRPTRSSMRNVPVSLFDSSPHGTVARGTLLRTRMDLRRIACTADVNFTWFPEVYFWSGYPEAAGYLIRRHGHVAPTLSGAVVNCCSGEPQRSNLYVFRP